MRWLPGLSLRTIAANRTEKGTSRWIIMIANEASSKESPVNVKPYCRVEPTKEIQNIFFNWPRGIGTNQTSASDALETQAH